MLQQNGGNLEQTLAAYNAGPNRAAEWLAWNTYREPAEFVESIPFTETRDYIQAVLRNADIYRRLYARYSSYVHRRTFLTLPMGATLMQAQTSPANQRVIIELRYFRMRNGRQVERTTITCGAASCPLPSVPAFTRSVASTPSSHPTPPSS